jgi:dihydrolipoamide dehydrogenase
MAETKKFDIAVIGSGPGGYTAAIRAAQLGKSVALIEKNLLGGTCLNVGCIPSKTLLSSAAVLHQVKKAAAFGISTGPVAFEYKKMKERKDQVVSRIRSGLEGLIKQNKITIIPGTASFENPTKLKIVGDAPCFIQADKIIIATGSIPFDVPSFRCDHQRILNSTSILELTAVPKSLAIIGGGYIGCEFASLFAELGCHVTILEALPSILSLQGKTVSQFMTKALTSRGITIQTGVKVEKVTSHSADVEIFLENQPSMKAELCLVAVGRSIDTQELKLEKAGLKTGAKGVLGVNEKMETEVSGIYAVGDITGKWMLAHVAAHQAMVAAGNAAGKEAAIHYEAVPAVIFTSPEVATVGLTLEEALQKGHKATANMLPFQALGKAQASLDTEGFVQIIADTQTGEVLGALVIGHEASNLISEMALAIQNELTIESIIETIHPHPTMGEAWLEAALIAADQPINFPPKVKR